MWDKDSKFCFGCVEIKSIKEFFYNNDTEDCLSEFCKSCYTVKKTKRCSNCGKFKPEKEFYKDKSKSSGYKSWCKTCLAFPK